MMLSGAGSSRARAAIATAAIFALLALAGGLRHVRESHFAAGSQWVPDPSPVAAPLDGPGAGALGPGLLRGAALSFDTLVADVYWMLALQQFGRARLAGGGPERYRRLQPLLDAATTLDPRFAAVYRTGAILLAEPPPGGPGRPDQALALLAKGRRAMPQRWEYPHDIGFIHYWWLRDYAAAARWFGEAGALPGAPWWLGPLAADTFTIGGSRQTSRALWQALRDSAAGAWLRGEAVRRLQQLDALDALDRFAREATRFTQRTGRPPTTWRDIAARGSHGAAPRDPAGYAYRIDPRAGTVSVAPESPLFPLPAEPPPVAP